MFVKYLLLWNKFAYFIGIGFGKPDMAFLIDGYTLGVPVGGRNGIPF